MPLPTSPLPAAARASCAAGPVFIAAIVFFFTIESNANAPVAIHPAALAALPYLLFTIPIGLFIAIVPNVIGTAALGWLGSGNIGMRLAPVWALAGAAAIGLPIAILGDTHEPVTHALMATGAISALLCRRGIAWAD